MDFSLQSAFPGSNTQTTFKARQVGNLIPNSHSDRHFFVFASKFYTFVVKHKFILLQCLRPGHQTLVKLY